MEVTGSGEPVTVFAHGVTGSTGETAPFAAKAPGTRVLLDLRGHGRSASPAPEAGYDHHAMRRDVAFVAGRFGATRALGVSMGGGAIMTLLAEEPDRFERLVFALPASIDAPNPSAGPLLEDLARSLETRSREDILASMESDPAQMERVARRPWLRDYVRDRVASMNATGMPRALRAFVHGAPPVDDASVLARVRAPALILAHEGDSLHDAAVARRLASLLPNAQLRVWNEPMAMFDDLGALARLVAEFLA